MFKWQKKKVRGKKKKRRAKIRAISREEIARMLIAERNSGRRSWRRNCLVILIIFYTGLRVQELCLQEVRDFIDESGEVREFLIVRPETAKRNKERIIPICCKASRIVRELACGKKLGSFVVGVGPRQVQRIFNDASRDAGLKVFSPHKARHSFATELMRNDVPLPVISELLGHESVETTGIYTNATEDDLRKAVETI